MTTRSLWDLFEHPAEIRGVPLKEAAAPVTEGFTYEDKHASVFARMPGDDATTHLLGAADENPMPGVSALALSRALRDGTIPFEMERKVRAYLAQHQYYARETVYESRNHHAISPDQRNVRIYGDDTVLPSSISATTSTGDVEDDGFNVEDIEF